ncbi:MAG: 3-deoxy-7-phosphoheptulonate synthase [Spirochaetales bacterium]|nr:3-deoxy-7-phosphoheptulonate synthase [Spirochaetales bacterium]
MKKIHNINITGITSLISPFELKKEFPMTEANNKTVVESRETITNILNKKDDRLMAIVGPCSIHDTKVALEYAEKLAALKNKLKDNIFIIMRTYFEKPRTTIGWKGLITDPRLDGTYDIATGLKTTRRLLLDITAMGIPCASEMLDPIVPQYIADLISWASIGARTTESQTHREMASGLSMPVGFKNGTSGNLELAVNAMESARHAHSFIGIDQHGKTAVFKTSGNTASHIILRGGRSGPNYYEENVEKAEAAIADLKITPAIVIDCSHANSGKQYSRQQRVLRSILDQRKRGRASIVGFMIESNLKSGSQKIPADLNNLVYGQSITDACAGWEETEKMLLYAYEFMKEKSSR